MLQQLGSFAEFERNRIIERVFPGMVRSIKEGHWHGARHAPLGYFYDKARKRLVVVKKEAELVNEIFAKYLSGLSTQKIAGELYQRSITTRSGMPFNSSLVRRVLRNKLYIGKIVWNTHHYDRKQKTPRGCRYVKNDPSQVIEAEGKHKPIISEEDFYQAQAHLDRNRRGNYVRRRERDYPLSGVMTCARCGSHYIGVSNVKNHKTGEKRPYYRCSGRAKYDIKCGNGDVRAEVPENQVFDILEILFSAKEVCLERLRNLVADQYRQRSTEKVVQELEKLKSELGQCHLKQSKLTDVYLEGTISREIFEEKSQKLKNEEGETRIKIERLELQLVEKEESKDYIGRAQRVVRSTQSVKENLDPATRKDFLKLVFKKLPVENQDIAMFKLYEPFNAMYQSALAARKEADNTGERRRENWKKSQSCLLRPSAGRSATNLNFPDDDSSHEVSSDIFLVFQTVAGGLQTALAEP